MARATLLNTWQPRFLSILRIVTGLIFMLHGTQKLLGFPPGEHPSPELMSLMGLGGVLELVGGALIVLGLFTRPVAFVLAGEMAVAYWMFHFKPDNIYPVNNGGDAAILYCFIFLYLVFAGPGPLSLDAARGRLAPPAFPPILDRSRDIDIPGGALASTGVAKSPGACRGGRFPRKSSSKL